MNQILFTNNNNNNYNKVDTKKIIKIFCVSIILVAIAIIAIKVYGMYENKKNNNNATPEISVLREDNETREITIKSTCKDGIQSLTYIWNEEEEKTINLNNSTSFERIVEMPQKATNTLKIKVTATNGVISEKTEVFTLDIDINKPTIDSISIVDNKLNIKASDDNGIKYLAYNWENEEEIIIEAEEGAKEMTTELDIQRGTFKLQIRVVDIYENEEILSRLITGVNEPEIRVIKYGDKINVSVTHDMGFKEIEFIINDSKYVYDENFSQYDKNKTTIELDFPLKEGENIVQINAYSLEKLTEEDREELDNYAFKRFTGKCTYEP